jgi:hypothetical protein
LGASAVAVAIRLDQREGNHQDVAGNEGWGAVVVVAASFVKGLKD